MLLAFVGAAQAQPDICANDREVDERVTVTKVIDGDTVRLSDGRKLRFAAVNSPELAHKDQNAEPLAEEAKLALEQWLEPDHTLLLRFDQKQRDHHQRLLAHPFLSDGRNVQALLLQKGLAAHIVEPPSLWSQNCYARLEQQAQRDRVGIWVQSRFASIPATELSSRAHGFYRINGKVINVSSNGRITWLKLSEKVSLRIESKDLKYFKQLSPEELRGHRVEAKGWLFPYGSGLNLRIKHPGALRIID